MKALFIAMLLVTSGAMAAPAPEESFAADYKAVLSTADHVRGGRGPFDWRDGGRTLAFATFEGGEWRTLLYDVAANKMISKASLEKPAAAPKILYDPWPATLPAERERPSPDGRYVLTLTGANLAMRDEGKKTQRQLTTGGVGLNRWSTANAVWSPDSRYVAVRKIDDTNTHKLPLIDWTQRDAQLDWGMIVRPGETLPVVRISVFDVQTGKEYKLPEGDRNAYFSIIGFDKAANELRIASLGRKSDVVTISAVRFRDASSRILLTEKSNTFLYYIPTFILGGPPIRFLSDDSFLWLSERTGWNQIYHYSKDGALQGELTHGDYPVTNIETIDEAGRRVYFRAQPDKVHPYDIQFLSVDLDALGTEARILTSEPGTHEILMAPDKAHFVDISSSVNAPPKAVLKTSDGKAMATLSEANTDQLRDLGLPGAREFTVKAGDDKTDLYGILLLPPNFDSRKKYPVIDVIYAGPQTNVVPHSFIPTLKLSDSAGPRMPMAELLAKQGYVVMLLDGRGTPGRGKAFQDVAFHGLGDHETMDHAAALRQLARQNKFIDIDRVGITGKSFGGYFTIRAMIQEPALFKAGVGVSSADLGTDTMAFVAEAYLGLPADNHDLYEATRNAPLVGAIRGNLLLLIGTHDVNTPFGQTITYAGAFEKANIPVDMAVLPNRNHALSIKSESQSTPPILPYEVLLMVRHFDRYLKPSH